MTWQIAVSAAAVLIAFLGLLRLAVFDILNKIDKQFEANEERHKHASGVFQQNLHDRDQRIEDRIEKVGLKLSAQFIARNEYEKEIAKLHSGIENMLSLIEQIDERLPYPDRKDD
jgi:hypothetical protein